jgi:hypothetical protein
MHRYVHLSQFDTAATIGHTVQTGQKIGLSGGVAGQWGAGLSTGAHLHYGVFTKDGGQAFDPLTILNQSQQNMSWENYQAKLNTLINNPKLWNSIQLNEQIKAALLIGDPEYLASEIVSRSDNRDSWQNFPLNKTLEIKFPEYKKDEELKDYSSLHLAVSNNDLPSLLKLAKEAIQFENYKPDLDRKLRELGSVKIENEGLKTENESLKKQLEEAKNKFSWNKAWIDLTRNGTFTTVAGVIVTTGTAFLVAKIPELAPHQGEIVLGLLGAFGISVAGQNLYQTSKISNANN